VHIFTTTKKGELKKICGETFLVSNQRDGAIFPVNEVGALIWKLCIEGRTTEEIVTVISKEYDVVESQVKKDVKAFIEKLIDLDYLEVNDHA